MERSVKRSRVGPSPFDRQENPDDDELNSRPEVVNALRDPGLQLQRSRAAAAFKLKSAWENIFEKYGKDFTGIGDEVDLRTGEIVVDNGHIQSLEKIGFGGEDGDEEEDDDEGDDDEGGAHKDEELRDGKLDNWSGLSKHCPVQLADQLPPPAFHTPWSAPDPFMGAPSLLSGALYPGGMPFGYCPAPMPLEVPQSIPGLDPTWRAPDLPPSTFNNVHGPGLPKSATRTKTKMPSIAAGATADNEDDVLLGTSPSTKGGIAAGDNGPGIPVSQNPLQVASSAAEGVEAGQESQPNPEDSTKAVRQIRYKLPDIVIKDRMPKKKRRKPNGKTQKELPKPSHQEQGDKIGNKPKVATGIDKDVAAHLGLPASPSQRSTPPRESEVHIYPPQPDMSAPQKRTIQELRVEIRAMTAANISSYMVIGPEPSREPEAPHIAQTNHTKEVSQGAMVLDDAIATFVSRHQLGDPLLDKAQDGPTPQAAGASNVDDHVPDQVAGDPVEEGDTAHNKVSVPKGQQKTAPAEVFSRNMQHPSYEFSDEEQPTIPRKAPARRKPAAPKSTAILTQEKTPVTTMALAARSELSPQDTSSKVSEQPAAPLDNSKLVSPESTPRPELVDVQPENYETMGANDPAQQVVEDIMEGVEGAPTPATSLLKMKPRRSGSRISLITPSTSTTSVAGSPQEPTLKTAPQRFPLRKRRRSSSGATAEDELPPILPGSPIAGSLPYDRVISETPEPLPLLPRQLSPDLGTLSPPDIPPSDEYLPLLDEAPHLPSEDLSTANNINYPPSPEQSQPQILPPMPPPQTPSRPKRGRRPLSATRPRGSLISLISDDEDELSLSPPHFSSARHPPSTTSKPKGTRTRIRYNPPSSNPPSSARSAKSTLTRRGAVIGHPTTTRNASKLQSQTRTPPSKTGSRRSYGAASASGAVSRINLRRTSSRLSALSGDAGEEAGAQVPGSPASRVGSELIQTPGGSMRRCGEGGFRCDRDFCFVCL